MVRMSGGQNIKGSTQETDAKLYTCTSQEIKLQTMPKNTQHFPHAFLVMLLFLADTKGVPISTLLALCHSCIQCDSRLAVKF